MDNTALIFPAFGNEFLGFEKEFLNNINFDCTKYLKELNFLGFNFNYDFLFTNHNDELTEQISCYTLSSILSDIVQKKNIKCRYIAGYSMGLYAAGYYSKSYDFKTGISLIKSAYELIKNATLEKSYSMCGVIGLTK